MAEIKCIICKERSGGEFVKLRENGLLRIIEVSEKRKDGIAATLDRTVEQYVHAGCRKIYTRFSNIKAYIRKRNLLSQEFGSVPFDFETRCFLCTQDASDDFIKKDMKLSDKRTPVQKVSKDCVKKTIMHLAIQRNDNLSATITQRIKDVDLVAIGARYHRECYNTYLLEQVVLPKIGGKKIGRPEVESVTMAMKGLFTFLEQNHEGREFALNELKSYLSGPAPHDKTIKKKIEDKYGDDVKVYTRMGTSPIICFRGSRLYDILQSGNKDETDVYESEESDEQEDVKTNIKTEVSIDKNSNDAPEIIPTYSNDFEENNFDNKNVFSDESDESDVAHTGDIVSDHFESNDMGPILRKRTQPEQSSVNDIAPTKRKRMPTKNMGSNDLSSKKYNEIRRSTRTSSISSTDGNINEKLDDILSKLESKGCCLKNKDVFDNFGIYIATMLRSMPKKSSTEVQPKIVGLITSAIANNFK